MFKNWLFYRDAPAWIQDDHPIMRREIQRGQSRTQIYNVWLRVFRWLSLGAFTLMLSGIGYLLLDLLVQNAPNMPFSQQIYSWQLFPMYFLQFLLFVGAFSLGMNTVHDQKRISSWDEIRATSDGIRLVMSVRWAYITFHHNAPLLKVIYLVRLIMIGALLYDLTAFGGNYLNYLLLQSQPAVPLWLGVFLVGANITAGLLLPLSMLSLTCALGVLASTYFKQPILIGFAKLTFIGLYFLVLTAMMLLLSSLYVETIYESNSILANQNIGIEGLFASISVLIYGDWGASLLYLGFLGEHVWVNIPYTIFMGVGMLAVIFVQALLTELCLRVAVYRAE
jgi:hypothetical protein